MKQTKDDLIQIIESNKAILYKICHSYGTNDEDRRDLYQEIVIQIWKSLQRYDPNFKMSTWIYRIALNTAISFYRKHKKDDLRDDASIDDVFTMSDETFKSNPLIDRLYEFINEFDPMNKALMLLYLDDYDHQNIAEILGLSATNVGTKIGRLKDKLKKRFETEIEV